MQSGQLLRYLWRPHGCPDQWWHLILACVHQDPMQRPTVPMILAELGRILATTV